MLRLLTVLTSLCLIIRGWRKLSENLDDIAEKMILDRPADVIEIQVAEQRNIGYIPRILACFLTPAKFCQHERDGSYDVGKRWVDLVLQGRLFAQFWRVLFCIAFMFGVFFVLRSMFDGPFTPSRSEFAYRWFQRVTLFDVVFMLILVFGVADATCSFWLFVKELGRNHSEWPLTTKTKYAKNLNMAASDPLLDYWIDIDFVAKRSACIGELIYYPFAVVALMIVSRSRAFANFDPCWPIIITQVICLSILVICALALRQAAERARAAAKEAITDGTISENEHRQGKLGALLSRIGGMQEGAFSPITQQAPVRAVLLPLASLGLTALTEYGLVPL
jgi:hypothetical protein